MFRAAADGKEKGSAFTQRSLCPDAAIITTGKLKSQQQLLKLSKISAGMKSALDLAAATQVQRPRYR